MGTGASTQSHDSNKPNLYSKDVVKSAVDKFKTIEEAVGKKPEVDDELLGELIISAAKSIIVEKGYKLLEESKECTLDDKNLKEDDERVPETVSRSLDTTKLLREINPRKEVFMDSTYIPSWLSGDEADILFHHLREIGESSRPKKNIDNATTKYPLWSIYYGFRRNKDGARALDRWGSYHESWLRVEGIIFSRSRQSKIH